MIYINYHTTWANATIIIVLSQPRSQGRAAPVMRHGIHNANNLWRFSLEWMRHFLYILAPILKFPVILRCHSKQSIHALRFSIGKLLIHATKPIRACRPEYFKNEAKLETTLEGLILQLLNKRSELWGV